MSIRHEFEVRLRAAFPKGTNQFVHMREEDDGAWTVNASFYEDLPGMSPVVQVSQERGADPCAAFDRALAAFPARRAAKRGSRIDEAVAKRRDAIDALNAEIDALNALRLDEPEAPCT